MNIARGEAAHAAVDEETADPLLGRGPDDGDVGDRPVGDPHLGAGQDPVGAVAAGAGLHARRVASVVRLGEAETADGLPGRHPGQPLVLLVLRAVFPDREHRQRALDRHEAAQAGVGGLHFPAGHAVGDCPHAGAAVTRQVHSEQAELAELRDQLAGERSGLEPVGDVGHDPVSGELAHGVADEALVVGQLVVDLQQVSAGWLSSARHGLVLICAVGPAASVCARLARAQPGRWRQAGGRGARVLPLRLAGVRDNAAMSYMNGSGGGKVLVRRRDNRIIAGVCAGLADYVGIDVNLLRVIVAALTLFTAGTGVLAYVIAWLVIPEEGQKTSIAEDFVSKNRQS